MSHITSYKDLRVYQAAMKAAMRIFELSKRFPIEERYSLTDQIRRASRSVCSNLCEAWRKRRYSAYFVNPKVKLKRLVFGWSSLGAAGTCRELIPLNSIKNTIGSLVNWFE